MSHLAEPYQLNSLEDYEKLSEQNLVERIIAQKQRYGSDLVILGHHYQRGKIVELSDFVGDSYGLSVKAAESKSKKTVFCGVRFMAESAAILSESGQKVYHPDPEAGCPMADMANIQQVEEAWRVISQAYGEKNILPVTYMNSTADLKAFCGEKGGLVCTSSNASAAFQWVYNKASLLFFFPDEHLGRNTGKKFGLTPEQMVVWDPQKPQGGLKPEDLKGVRLVLWKGHCPVHMEFKLRDIKNVRSQFPGCKVVVHPECEKEVVDGADAAGSTEFIVKYVREAPEGSVIFVGTEVNLITRLQKEFPFKKIFKLQRSLCLTMYQINLANLCYTLDHLDKLETVELTEKVKSQAKVALDRMLQLQL